MQSRSKDGVRPRIGVSVDADVYDWIQSLPGPSDSYKVSRVLRAAMEAGIGFEESSGGKSLEQFAGFLSKRKKNKLAAELKVLLDEFLSD